MSSIFRCVELTAYNFQHEVVEARGLVLVDCWASWCGLSVLNSIEELAIEFATQIKVCRLDVGTFEELATHYNIRAVPTLLFLKEGQVMERIVGGVSKQDLICKINVLAAKDRSRSRIVCL